MSVSCKNNAMNDWKDIVIDSQLVPEITENAKLVLEKRYFAKDEEGQCIEDAKGMFRRVARYIAFADTLYGKEKKEIEATALMFYEMMSKLEFLPNSPTLMNAGRALGQLAACFVLPVEDSMDKIFDSLKDMALIHKSGGGTGFSFSNLRPKSDIVQSTAGISSGPVSFINIFNAATETVKQGGTRRGANMAILNVTHPDIIEFIRAKEDTTALTNFNCSVGLTEEFMKAVENDSEYGLINPRTGQEVQRLRAREVFDLIVQKAWENGEPGIVFLDRINEQNPLKQIGEIESTNPCGEQPLLPYESCNLGSINLESCVMNNGPQSAIDYEKLKCIVAQAVHFLDNVIDMNKYPLDKIETMTKANRKIGLGVMGFASLLIKLGVPYNSEEAILVARNVMSTIQQAADEASLALAAERGVFPHYDKSSYAPTNKKYRNATRTTIAPTGTISIIANTSSGIEPLFALAYARNIMDNNTLLEVNDLFETVLKEKGLYSRELMEQVASEGSVSHIDTVPAEVKKLFVTAHDITPEDHIRIQAVFQEFTDNAVSKTVNFKHGATQEDIKRVYQLAYDLKCKGVTVYRDGSRSGQVLTVERKKEKNISREEASCAECLTPRSRNEVISGVTRKMVTGCGSLYVTLNEDENGLFEAFAVMGKSGGCAASQTEAISRLISLCLRCGINVDQIIKQLKGVRCPNQAWGKGGRIYSCADAIAKAMEQYEGVEFGTGVTNVEQAKHNAETNGKGSDSVMVGVCPDCHGPLEFESGCSVCRSCGFSRCG